MLLEFPVGVSPVFTVTVRESDSGIFRTPETIRLTGGIQVS